MLNRNIFLIIAVLATAAGPATGAEGITLSTGTMSLDQVFQHIVKNNPDVLSTRYTWKAAEARAGSVKSWPNPMASYAKEETPMGEEMTHLRVEQEIPFPGKLSREAQMAKHEALIARAKHRATTLKVLADARTLYYRLYTSDRLTSLLAQNVETAKTLMRTAESRFSASGSMGASKPMGMDLLMLRTELGRMENMLFEEEQERALTRFRLNSLLDRPLDAPIARTEPPELKEVPFTLKDLLVRARSTSPEYLAATHEENHARSMLSRSRFEFAPDLNVMYDRQTAPGGETGYEAGIGLSLPLWMGRPLAQLREAKAHRREAETLARRMRNDADQEVAQEYTEIQTHLTLARRYETIIIPSAESALRLARRQYETGGVTYDKVLLALKSLTDAHIEYHKHVNEYAEHWGILEQCCGLDLSTAEELAPEEGSHD